MECRWIIEKEGGGDGLLLEVEDYDYLKGSWDGIWGRSSREVVEK